MLDPDNQNQIFDFFQIYGVIPSKSFFKQNEILDLLQVRPYVLRFWETEFDRIKTTKSPSGQIIYRFEDAVVLFMIKKFLVDEKLPLENARLRLDQELNASNYFFKHEEISWAEEIESMPAQEGLGSLNVDCVEESVHFKQDELNKLLLVRSADNLREDLSFVNTQYVSSQNAVGDEIAVDSLFSTMAIETFESNENENDASVSEISLTLVKNIDVSEDNEPSDRADGMLKIIDLRNVIFEIQSDLNILKKLLALKFTWKAEEHLDHP